MGDRHDWRPPGKDCGLCGEKDCASFLRLVRASVKDRDACPFHGETETCSRENAAGEAIYSGRDVLGHPFDFVLAPLEGEVSARKIVLPFRGELVQILQIKPGDRVLGRPMGAGCPIPHILEVIEVEPLTSVIHAWVIGPRASREGKVKDVAAYFMLGFEGLATEISKEPTPGCRATFLPGFCMMALNHTGLVNMVLAKKNGLHVRIEDIRIMAGRE